MPDVTDLLFGGLKNIVPQVGAEISRLGTQGTMELASALFNGSAFVPYGPGQYTDSVEPQPKIEQQYEMGRDR